MELDTTILILFFIPLTSETRTTKCCRQDQKILEQNLTFSCEVNENRRIQSNFDNVSFMNENKPGYCIDIYGNNKIALFFVNDSTRNISIKENVEVKYFPKCCPLGQQYNTSRHSCELGNNDKLELFFSNSFVRIGLPQCEIISDHILDNLKNVKINNDSTVLLDSERIMGSGKYCIDTTSDKKFVIRVCETGSQICGQVRCIHKCCPDGQSFARGKGFDCIDNFTNGVNLYSSRRIQDPNSPFTIIHGFQQPMYPLYEERYNFFMDKTGLLTIFVNKTQTYQYFDVSENVYCMEHQFRKRKGVEKSLYIIFFRPTNQKLETKYAITRWVKILSCIFLLLTITVYLVLPKMRNLFGKILLNYCAATFLMFFFFTFSQFNPNGFNESVCRLIGYCSVFSLICSFTWLNIMSIDIWISFSTPRTTASTPKREESKLLLQYCFYGWIVPLIWIFLIALLSKLSIVSESIRPYLGKKKCFIEDYDTRPGNFASIIFVILPLLVQQLINIIVFMKTVRYCYKVKTDIERMNNPNLQSNFEAAKKSMVLMVKLGVIMGVSFLFEIISSIYDFKITSFTTIVEVVWDTINCLQGFFIFVIFICKKKVFHSLCEKMPFSLTITSTVQIHMKEVGQNRTTH